MKKSFGPKTMIYPNPVLVIGTYNNDGIPNLLTASWAGIASSEPAAIAISIRKTRYTYKNLNERMCFTVNVPSEKHIKDADYCGVYSGKDCNKFDDLGLTAVKSEFVDAPIVDEFPVALSCKVVEIHDLGLHIQFIGQILDVAVDENVLDEKGVPVIDLIKPFVYDVSSRAYYSIGEKLMPAYSTIKK